MSEQLQSMIQARSDAIAGRLDGIVGKIDKLEEKFDVEMAKIPVDIKRRGEELTKMLVSWLYHNMYRMGLINDVLEIASTVVCIGRSNCKQTVVRMLLSLVLGIVAFSFALYCVAVFVPRTGLVRYLRGVLQRLLQYIMVELRTSIGYRLSGKHQGSTLANELRPTCAATCRYAFLPSASMSAMRTLSKAVADNPGAGVFAYVYRSGGDRRLPLCAIHEAFALMLAPRSACRKDALLLNLAARKGPIHGYTG